jgi:hypothetical protein
MSFFLRWRTATKSIISFFVFVSKFVMWCYLIIFHMGYNFKISQNNLKKKHKKNDYLLTSFEKAFINEFLRIILSPRDWEFFPMKLGKQLFSHWDWGRYSAHKTQSQNHCKHFKSVLRTLTKFVLFQKIFRTWTKSIIFLCVCF